MGVYKSGVCGAPICCLRYRIFSEVFGIYPFTGYPGPVRKPKVPSSPHCLFPADFSPHNQATFLCYRVFWREASDSLLIAFPRARPLFIHSKTGYPTFSLLAEMSRLPKLLMLLTLSLSVTFSFQAPSTRPSTSTSLDRLRYSPPPRSLV